ncbi:MAG TPA: hypothetical protein VFC10_06090 [Terriglobia bacterium]|nr:hypothetical protein [Terriglobia bacterium]
MKYHLSTNGPEEPDKPAQIETSDDLGGDPLVGSGLETEEAETGFEERK